MTDKERGYVVQALASSLESLLATIEPLSPDQWTFREAPDRWSIADNVEHLALFEAFILNAIQAALEGPLQPEKAAQAASKNHLIESLPDTRHRPLTAREATRPRGLGQTPEAIVAALRQARSRTLAFVSSTQADLHLAFFAHIAFGDLDCYQWLLVLDRHTARHLLQIQQVKSSDGFPAG